MRNLTLSLITGLMLSNTAFGRDTRSPTRVAAAPTYESSITLAIRDAQDAQDEAVLASETYIEELVSTHEERASVVWAGDSERSMTFEESIQTDTDEPDGSPARNPTYEVPMELVLEIEINRLIELQEILELHGEEHDLVGEIGFDQIMADIDQIIAQAEQMDAAGMVGLSAMDWVDLAMANPASQAGTFLKEFFTLTLEWMQEVDEGGLNALRNQEERDNRDYDLDGDVGHPEEEGTGGDDDADDGADDGDEGSEGGSDDETGEETDGLITLDQGEDDGPGGIFGPTDGPWDTDGDGDDEDGGDGPMSNGTPSSLIDLIDQAYSPVAFGEAVQTSLETTGLEGIRTLVDDQLDALEQLNAR